MPDPTAIQFEPDTLRRLAALDIGERAEVRKPVPMRHKIDGKSYDLSRCDCTVMQNDDGIWLIEYPTGWDDVVEDSDFQRVINPFRTPGTRLWVRTSYFAVYGLNTATRIWDEFTRDLRYEFGGEVIVNCSPVRTPIWRKRSPVTMPHWASRIHLVTVASGVEQVDGAWYWLATLEREGARDGE